MQPFPEEANRRLISNIMFTFCFTKLAKENLIKSNVSGKILLLVIRNRLFIYDIKKQIKNYEIKNFDWCDQKLYSQLFIERKLGSESLGRIKGIKK